MTFTNMNQFLSVVDEFFKKIPGELVKFHKQISFDLFQRLILKTPVDTGRARGNWQMSEGSPIQGLASGIKIIDTGPFPLENPPPLSLVGQESLEKGLENITGLAPFSTVWIVNNVAYIGILEDGDGSRQAPQGMLKITLQEFIVKLTSINKRLDI